MSVEIVRLLLGLGASEREVEAVLATAQSNGRSLARTLVEQGSPLFDPLERELVRRDVASIEIVRPALEEVALLPPGLCDRLGAVPVRRDPRSGRVDVAALDPLDQHLADELAFHLGAKVRVLRARPDALLPALTVGSTARIPSGPPLPLVRKAALTEAAPRTQAYGAAGGLETNGAQTSPAAASAPTRLDEDGEPVLSLTRPKAMNAPREVPAAAPVVTAESPGAAAEAFADVLTALEAAEAPEAVVALLIRGMVPARSLVLAVRGGAYEGRSGSAEVDADALRKLRLLAGESSVLDTAVKSGLYLGVLPHTPVHQGLRSLLGAEREVYVVPITASGRASLIFLAEVQPLGSTLDTTRRADELSRAAGAALTSILRSKKRQR